MLNVIEIYRSKRVSELTAKKDADIIAIKTKNPVYKALRDARKNLLNGEELVITSGFEFDDATNKAIEEVRVAYKQSIADLDKSLEEVCAMVDLADDKKQSDKILTTYGILTADGFIA